MQLSPYIPTPHPGYIPFGIYTTLARVVKQPGFRAVMVVGETGNGKTQAIEQAHAAAKRPLIRLNCTIETDEAALGYYELRNGETHWQDGPITIAAKHDCSLLLDEVDYLGTRGALLQAVLEGKPFVLKNGERVIPHPNFKIFATANTYGRGSHRYVGNQIQNEALLDRFHYTLVQDYPAPTTELRILKAALPPETTTVDDLALTQLVRWAALIRETFDKGGADDTMTTRRLLNLVRTLPDFQHQLRDAVEAAVRRFGPTTADAFLTYFDKLTPDPAATTPDTPPPAADTTNADDDPFRTDF